jgi:hypothetical protein
VNAARSCNDKSSLSGFKTKHQASTANQLKIQAQNLHVHVGEVSVTDPNLLGMKSDQTTEAQKMSSVRPTGTRFVNKVSYFEPGTHEHDRDIFIGLPRVFFSQFFCENTKTKIRHTLLVSLLK